MISLTKWLENKNKLFFFSQTHLDIFIILVQKSVFFLQCFIIHEDNVLEYPDKNYAAKGEGVRRIGEYYQFQKSELVRRCRELDKAEGGREVARFFCGICDRAFSRNQNLIRHVEDVHTVRDQETRDSFLVKIWTGPVHFRVTFAKNC